MKKILVWLLPALALILSCAPGQTDGAQESARAEFREFLTLWEQAQTEFTNGDSSLWLQNASAQDDVSIFGAFGGYERGQEEVNGRYAWASSQFRASGSRKHIEYLNVGVSGDLAFSVSLERDDVRIGEQEQTQPRQLRATQIFRREDGRWKLVHRHADPLVERDSNPR